MGQITNPAAPGINVLPTDRETGPGAGAGNTGNLTLFFGSGAGENNTGADCIAIGNSALNGGNLVSGVIAIGVNAEKSANTQIYAGNVDIAIGNNANAMATACGSMVVIGTNALSTLSTNTSGRQGQQSVVIGNNCMTINIGALQQAVIIGDSVCGTQNPHPGNGGITNSTLIGFNNFPNYGQSFNPDIIESVVIGDNVMPPFGTINSSQCSQTVIIGSAGLSNVDGSQYTGTGLGNIGLTATVAIGTGTSGNTAFQNFNCVAVGAFSLVSQNSVSLGAYAGIQAKTGNYPGAGSIYIGCNSGYSGATPNDYTLLIETSDGANLSFTYSIIYGEMNTGNLALGNLPAADRTFSTIGCTNTLMLTNGIRGSSNPTGGGFFYVNAGALHWVGSSGTDTTLAVA